MGHGGETVVISPQSHHAGNHHPHIGGPSSKKPRSLAKSNIGGNGVGGLGHSHENSKGSSSKVSKKSHSHSTNSQPQSKAINVGKARQGNLCSPNGNRASPGSLQHFHQQHLMKQQSRHWNASTSRQKSFSPPTLHPMPSGEANSRTVSPVLSGSKAKEHFYAGARFETHPSHIGLPVPPSHWTAPLQRSQSQPSSPVPLSVPQKGISVDLATLFGYSSTDSALKSASFPGERMMGALVKMEDERKLKQELNEKENVSIDEKSCSGSRAKAQVTTTNSTSGMDGKSIAINETDELKKALGLAFTCPVRAVANRSCGLSLGSELSPSRYQDISDQLKTLLKVAA